MKIMKKISAILLALVLCVPCISMVAHAADGSISFTDPDTAVGEMVEIKCVVRSGGGNLGDIEIKLSYDSASLRFDSGDGITAEGNGALTCKGTGSSSEASFTMTFQALKEGSTKVTIASQTVNSSSGNKLSLDEGDSTVTIAAGDPSKIKPAATEPAAGDMQVEVNGETYTLTDNFADADIPSGYSRTTVSLDGQDRQMATNESGTIYLGYLLDSQNLGDFFIYNEENATFSPYEQISISDTTSIVVLSDTSKVKLPKTYQEAKLTLNEKDFPVWMDTEHEGYYILYAINNNGETGYYQYDTAEGTYQRVEISSDEKEEKNDSSLMGKIRSFLDDHLQLLVLVLGFGGIIILILIIVLAVKLRNRNLELDDLYDEYGIDLEEEEPPVVKDKKKDKKQDKKSKSGRRVKEEDNFDDFGDDFDEDEFDEDDFDEDEFDEDDFDEDEFDEEEFEEDDIFSDEKLSKYDTKSIYQDAPLGGMDDEDDLDELLGSLSSEKKSKPAKKKDAFEIDFIDLD